MTLNLTFAFKLRGNQGHLEMSFRARWYRMHMALIKYFQMLRLETLCQFGMYLIFNWFHINNLQ